MELLQRIKNNSSTFHIRTKEEIDQLFCELSMQKLPVDNKLDFYIRMSIQKVKLQLYYELKLDEYRRTVNSATKVQPCEITPNKAGNKKSIKKTAEKKKSKTSLQKEDEMRRNKTKEELIAENKARVAQFHPEPDFSTCPRAIHQSRKKIEFEREMKEKNKNHWLSIVSVPMGGMNKR